MEKVFKTSEVARVCNCHPRTVLNWCKKGFLSPPRDINGHRLFSRGDVEKMQRLLNTTWGKGRSALRDGLKSNAD